MNRQATNTHRFDPGLILLALILMIIVTTFVFIYFDTRNDEIGELVQQGMEIPILIAFEQEGRLVASELLIYNPTTMQGALFDLPPNIGAIIDAPNRIDRIDSLYNEGNYEQYRSEIVQLLAVSVPFYIRIDSDNFEYIIDLLEGIEVLVTDPPFEDGRPTLPSGSVLLDGYQVRAYLMALSGIDDEETRTKEIQHLVVQLLATIGERAEWLTHPRVLPFLKQNVDTNLENDALASLIEELSKLDTGQIITRSTTGVLRSVKIGTEPTLLLFPHFEGQWLRESIQQVQNILSGDRLPVDSGRTIRIRILNGTANNGLARRTKVLYENYGFDIVSIGNTEQGDLELTQIIDHAGNGLYARQVAEIIQASNILFDTNELGDSEAHVTVILGGDFDGVYVRQ